MKNFLAVGDLEGYIHFLNLEDGKFTARVKLDSEPAMALIAGNNPTQIIAATRGGGLYAVSVTGNVKSTASAVEPSVVLNPEKSTDSDNVDDTSRSILFKKDSVLLPDEQFGSGPGISLPKAE
jgi:hypothetical protein